ncbi:MAG: hypothetical protein LT071_14085 [Nocardioides sp.]|nr:hypothetical protein [Nocardioides sp.]
MNTVVARFPETLAVVRLGPGTDVPAWAESSSVFAIIATATETTLVCAARSVPGKAPAIRPLTAFQVKADAGSRGSTAAALAGAATEVGAEVLAYDTFEHTWLLVPVASADAVEEEWRRRGHTVAPAVPVRS